MILFQDTIINAARLTRNHNYLICCLDSKAIVLFDVMEWKLSNHEFMSISRKEQSVLNLLDEPRCVAAHPYMNNVFIVGADKDIYFFSIYDVYYVDRLEECFRST